MMPSMQSRQKDHPRPIRKFIAASVLALSLVAATPHGAYASSDEDVEHYDARVQGYDPNVELKSWGNGGSWMMLIFMAVVCVAVIFKDAKRSHLD
jgi:hypothetical protein